MAAMRGEGEAIPEATQKAFAAQAKLNVENGYVVQREKLLAAIADIRPYARDRATAKQLQGIERQCRALVGRMLASA